MKGIKTKTIEEKKKRGKEREKGEREREREGERNHKTTVIIREIAMPSVSQPFQQFSISNDPKQISIKRTINENFFSKICQLFYAFMVVRGGGDPPYPLGEQGTPLSHLTLK
jgi:hypothetical protein